MIKYVKLLLILPLIFLTQSCGYELIQYRSNPSLTITFDIKDASHLSIKNTMQKISKEFGLRYADRPLHRRNGYFVMSWSKKFNMFASPFFYDPDQYNVTFYYSRIPWRKLSEEQLIKIAKEYEAELLKIENVKLISFEVFE